MNLQPSLRQSIHWMVLCLFCLSLRAQGNGEKLPTSKASPMDRLAWIQGPTNVSLV